jgi:hypothetical protein
MRAFVSICGSILIMLAIAAGVLFCASYVGNAARGHALPALMARIGDAEKSTQSLWSRVHFTSPVFVEAVPVPQPRPVVPVVEPAPVVVQVTPKPPTPPASPVVERKSKPKHHEKHKHS